jgi:hypothetical protein
MTKDDKLFLLEEELRGAGSMIQFLHDCLTNERFKYAYPDMTLKLIEDIEKLAPARPWCIHSRHDPECASCQIHVEIYPRLYALRVEAGLVKPNSEET